MMLSNRSRTATTDAFKNCSTAALKPRRSRMSGHSGGRRDRGHVLRADDASSHALRVGVHGWREPHLDSRAPEENVGASQ
jgi:hypothetical protein